MRIRQLLTRGPVTTALEIAGAGVFSYGVGMIHLAAGVCTAGVAVMVFAWLGGR